MPIGKVAKCAPTGNVHRSHQDKTIPVIGKERRSKNAAPTMTTMHRSIINGTMAFDHKIQRGEIVYGISATDYLQKVA